MPHDTTLIIHQSSWLLSFSTLKVITWRWEKTNSSHARKYELNPRAHMRLMLRGIAKKNFLGPEIKLVYFMCNLEKKKKKNWNCSIPIYISWCIRLKQNYILNFLLISSQKIHNNRPYDMTLNLHQSSWLLSFSTLKVVTWRWEKKNSSHARKYELNPRAWMFKMCIKHYEHLDLQFPNYQFINVQNMNISI